MALVSRIERLVAPAGSTAPVGAEDVGVSEDDGAEREIEAVMAAGDESADGVDGAACAADPMPSAAEIQRLVSGLSVRRTAAGGLVLEASPEAASALAALFSGMAQLLQSAATPAVVGGRPGQGLQRKYRSSRSLVCAVGFRVAT